MAEAQPVIEYDQPAAQDEERVRQLDDGKVSKVACVHHVRGYAERAEVQWEGIEDREEGLDSDDDID